MAEVVTTGEARDALHQIARRFDAGEGGPVYFGSHRRAQGVIVPVEVWERLLEQAKTSSTSTSPTVGSPPAIRNASAAATSTGHCSRLRRRQRTHLHDRSRPAEQAGPLHGGLPAGSHR